MATLPPTLTVVGAAEIAMVPTDADPMMLIDTELIAPRAVAETVTKGAAVPVSVTVATPLASVTPVVDESAAFVASFSEKVTVAPTTALFKLSLTVAVMTDVLPAEIDVVEAVTSTVAPVPPVIVMGAVAVAVPTVAVTTATVLIDPAVKVTVASPFVVVWVLIMLPFKPLSRLKVTTVPSGAAFPELSTTRAVTWVVPPVVTDAGLAETDSTIVDAVVIDIVMLFFTDPEVAFIVTLPVFPAAGVNVITAVPLLVEALPPPDRVPIEESLRVNVTTVPFVTGFPFESVTLAVIVACPIEETVVGFDARRIEPARLAVVDDPGGAPSSFTLLHAAIRRMNIRKITVRWFIDFFIRHLLHFLRLCGSGQYLNE